LDDTDRRILNELNLAPRMAFREIGRRIGMSEAQVGYRVKALARNGVARTIAIVNPMSLGAPTMAWLGLRVASGNRIVDVAATLARDPGVT
jgi:DNA-binding Lrp family transcriptional regulator